MFRRIILAEMGRRGLSHYSIVERVADRIPRRTVYNYLAGETDMGGERVAILTKELGLTLRHSSIRK